MRYQAWLFLVFTVIAAAAVFGFFGMTAFRSAPEFPPAAPAAEAVPLKQDRPLVTWLDPSQGPAGARTTVIEYSNYLCPYCLEAESGLKQFLAKHPEVRLVWKDLPNPLMPGSDLAAEAAQCAKSQGKFWEYHDRLFAESGATTEIQLTLLAKGLGLDATAFGQCLSSREMKPFVEHTASEAAALGIDGTPYFFINGTRHSGAMTYEQLEASIR